MAPFFANLVMCSLTCEGTAAEGTWQESLLDLQQCVRPTSTASATISQFKCIELVFQLALALYLCLCCFHP